MTSSNIGDADLNKLCAATSLMQIDDDIMRWNVVGIKKSTRMQICSKRFVSDVITFQKIPRLQLLKRVLREGELCALHPQRESEISVVKSLLYAIIAFIERCSCWSTIVELLETPVWFGVCRINVWMNATETRLAGVNQVWNLPPGFCTAPPGQLLWWSTSSSVTSGYTVQACRLVVNSTRTLMWFLCTWGLHRTRKP